MKDLFNIKKRDYISVTGAGGKTSLIVALAQNLKKFGKVLITTSTKMIVKENQVDYLYKNYEDYRRPTKPCVVGVFGKVVKENKLDGLTECQLENVKNDFDYILIEADGARRLPFKIWKDHEPVIYPISNKTIGVLSIKVLDKKVDKDLIYNIEDIDKYNDPRTIDKDLILNILSDKNTYFKNSKEKILYINQVESKEEEKMARNLIEYLKENLEQDIKYIYGSVKEDSYYVY